VIQWTSLGQDTNYNRPNVDFSFCFRNQAKSLDILYHLAVNFPLLNTRQLGKAVRSALYDDLTDNEDEEEVAILMDGLRSTHSRFADLITKTKRLPVILIIDPVSISKAIIFKGSN